MNGAFFNQLVSQYPKLQGMKMEGNTLICNQSVYSIESLDVEKYLRENIYLNSSFDKIEANDLFNILKVEDIAKKNEKLESEEELDAIKSTNPVIKNIGYIQKKDEIGVMRTYIHYVDEFDKDHILYQYAPGDVLEVYKDLLSKKQASVTEKDLFEALNEKMKNVELTSLYNMHNLGEKYSKEMEEHNKKYGDSYALGNEEHNIIVTDHQVYTLQQDEEGNLKKEGHSIVQESSGLEEDEKAEIKEEQQNEVEEILFITETQFYEYIFQEKELSEGEQRQVNLFYAFLFDVMVYNDYLSDEAKSYLDRYNNMAMQLQAREGETSLSAKEEEVLSKYYELIEKKESQEITKDKIHEKVRTLKMPDRGYSLGSVIVILTILAGIVLAWYIIK